jgi:hypothetical protein
MGPIFWKEYQAGKFSLREDSDLFMPEFGYRQDEPSQQGFAADGLRIVEFFFPGLRTVY